MSKGYPLLGAAFALAGADKMSGDKGYDQMFRHLGWPRDGMRAVAAAEITGGLMLSFRATRRLGAGVLAVTSASVLLTEVQRGEPKLAGPRALLLLASLGALFSRG